MTPLNWKANTFQRLVQRLAARPLTSKILARVLSPLDRLVMRISGDRLNATSLLAGLPIITLTTVGARSNFKRHTFLVAIPIDNQLVLIASNFGGKTHPHWYSNLQANPHVEVAWPKKKNARPYIARPIEENERMKYWKAANQLYPGFQAYQERAFPRTIPIIELTPSIRSNLQGEKHEE